MKKFARILLLLLSVAVVGVSGATAMPREDKEVTAVPEPATMLLIGVGAGAAMIGRAVRGRFKRRDDK
jgi:hypothetical protein